MNARPHWPSEMMAMRKPPEGMDVIRLHKNLLPFFVFQFSSMMCQFSVVESKSATFPPEKPRHLLDDSVLESHSPVRNHTLSSVFSNGISIGKYATLQIQ